MVKCFQIHLVPACNLQLMFFSLPKLKCFLVWISRSAYRIDFGILFGFEIVFHLPATPAPLHSLGLHFPTFSLCKRILLFFNVAYLLCWPTSILWAQFYWFRFVLIKFRKEQTESHSFSHSFIHLERCSFLFIYSFV